MAYVNQPEDVVSRLRRIEARLDELTRKVGLSSATINRGTLSLLGNSRFEVVDNDGDLVARLGSLGYRYSDDSPQQGVEFRYDHDQPAIAVWRPINGANPATKQFAALYATDGTIICSSDANSNFGMGRPWLPISFERARTTEWASTTSGTFEALYEAQTHQQHPWIEARIVITAAAGTSGEARLVVAGSVIGDPVTYSGAGAAVADLRSGRIVQPYGTLTNVNVEVRRTAGAGNVLVRIDAWWRQT